ncbi:MAG: TetR/AcrR family transcriptional regulator [Gammaproteobacteria bacterium]
MPGSIERILAAAEEEFLDKGFEAASIDGTARRAGAGRMTIYRHFQDKLALFRAVIARINRDDIAAIAITVEDRREPREVLRDAALRILQWQTRPRNIGLQRIINSEIQRFPELARELWASEFQAVLQPLGGYFEALMREGRIVQCDPLWLSRLFNRMIYEGFRHMMGLGELPGKPAGPAGVELIVGIFLGGVELRAPAPRRNRRGTRR